MGRYARGCAHGREPPDGEGSRATFEPRGANEPASPRARGQSYQPGSRAGNAECGTFSTHQLRTPSRGWSRPPGHVQAALTTAASPTLLQCPPSSSTHRQKAHSRAFHGKSGNCERSTPSSNPGTSPIAASVTVLSHVSAPIGPSIVTRSHAPSPMSLRARRCGKRREQTIPWLDDLDRVRWEGAEPWGLDSDAEHHEARRYRHAGDDDRKQEPAGECRCQAVEYGSGITCSSAPSSLPSPASGCPH